MLLLCEETKNSMYFTTCYINFMIRKIFVALHLLALSLELSIVAVVSPIGRMETGMVFGLCAEEGAHTLACT